MRSANDPSPMLAAMDLIGQRWILRLVWELEPGPLGFLALRRRVGNCSSSVLSERLQQLQTTGVIVKDANAQYELTDIGVELGVALEPLWSWSEQWTLR